MFKSLFRRTNQLKFIQTKSFLNKNSSILSSFNRSFSSAEQATPPTASFKSVHTESLGSLGLDYLGATKDSICYRNLPYGEIQDHAIRNREALLTSCGALAVDTGKFTGRSPLDKFIVKQEPSQKNIWWGDINQSMNPETFDILYDRIIKHYQNESERVYVLDAYCGAHESSRRSVRFVTEKAWHQHFVKNMFIRIEDQEELEDFDPDFTVINAYGLVANDWKQLGLHSEVFVAFNVEKKIAIIGGAWYGGEMKKGIFSMMHYWLPQENCLSMHCSANIGQSNDVCLFFGLSGTGKTTLSTDPDRRLIGDDEHGWDNEGIFNFEGGCYAKTSKLSLDTEPEIYRAVKFNSLMENVWISPYTHDIDYFNLSITENGRVSYPIEHIENREDSLAGGHPQYIIFLCCDAFGVLPPIAKLNSGQSMYHFISGYTAKVAGTERGIKEPQATFSPCYGAAFLTLHPMEYARLMKKKLENHNVDCYLVNTGWSGGGYGEGERMSIKATRNCINAIFNGAIKKSRFREDPLFKFSVPENIPGVDSRLLNPRNTWKDKKAFDRAAIDLANRFAENITQYTDDSSEYEGCGPIGQVKTN